MDDVRTGSPETITRAGAGAPLAALEVRDGRCVALNDAARSLFPALRPGDAIAPSVPGWLAATAETAEDTSGAVGDRWCVRRRVIQHDGSELWWLSEVMDTRAAQQQWRAERERTALLARLSTTLLSALVEPRCQQITAELAAGHLADAAVVVTAGELPGEHEVTLSVHGRRARLQSARIDPEAVPGLAEALSGFPPVPAGWLAPSQVPSWLVPAGFGPVGPVAVTTLPGHAGPAGALVLLRTETGHGFTQEEQGFARSFAAQAGTAICASRLLAREASTAEALNRQLRPPKIGRLDGVDYCGRYRAADDVDRVGGDFYDVYPRPVTRERARAESVAVLGDVCGKGVDAAVLTGKVRTALHALLRLVDDHDRVLNLLNDVLRHDGEARFVTLALASVSWHDAQVRVRVTTAGHVPPLVVRADGRIEPAGSSGTLLGVLPVVTTCRTEFFLAPGETCLLYSDGVTEARGGPFGDVMFGRERLAEALTACAGMPAGAVAEHVHMRAVEWAGSGRHDDMSVLAITAPGRNRQPEAQS